MLRPDASVFAEGDGFTLLHGDATSIPLDDGTVDAIVTSPPYFALRSYTDDGEHFAGQIGSEATPQEFLEALWAVTAECRRVLKPSGSLFVNLGDKYSGNATGGRLDTSGSTLNSRVKDVKTGRARSPYVDQFRPKSLMMLPHRYVIGCIDQLDLICRAEIPWSKPNGLPESVTDRVRRSHEMWFHMTKEPRYYSAVDEIREPHTGGSNPGRKDGKPPPGGKTDRLVAAGDHGGNYGGTNPDLFNPLGKLPGSVWTIPSEPLMVPDYFVEDDLGPKMLDRGPLWQWVEHRVHQGDYGPVEVRPIDHFAAFPQEWPRRLILGWSPSGICCECGEGRRPVTDVDYVPAVARGGDGSIKRNRKARSDLGDEAEKRGWDNSVMDRVATITGEACACGTPTAPTRPAVILDPFGGTGTTAMVARALGRHGVHLDLSLDYLRLARWRIEQSGHAAKTVNRTNRDRQGTLL